MKLRWKKTFTNIHNHHYDHNDIIENVIYVIHQLKKRLILYSIINKSSKYSEENDYNNSQTENLLWRVKNTILPL